MRESIKPDERLAVTLRFLPTRNDGINEFNGFDWFSETNSEMFHENDHVTR